MYANRIGDGIGDGGSCRHIGDLANAFHVQRPYTLHGLAGPWLFPLGAELGATWRVALAVALVAPLAFAMGLPFPLVLARLRTVAPRLVPWAWGVNGCASVIAAVLAGALAMSLGTRSLVILGVLAYVFAAVVQRGVPHAPRAAC